MSVLHETDEKSGELLEYPVWGSMMDHSEEKVDMHFITYFVRANRRGRGMMRVGRRTI